ncbi:hypothetical protein GUJ93_ZPchr0001g32690 [Zizania palustris]|uniref:Uncharacterized protein n=1 Tax=Zizania palustris TaxID=103762 RepID=A0A8J5VSI8_ZIZPA|nr:hypothetical protein GUJ93_ZPchr0001g32690 [Zizania palustris]
MPSATCSALHVISRSFTATPRLLLCSGTASHARDQSMLRRHSRRSPIAAFPRTKHLYSSWLALPLRANRLHALLRQCIVRPKISARRCLSQNKTEDLASGFVEKKKTDQKFGSL